MQGALLRGAKPEPLHQRAVKILLNLTTLSTTEVDCVKAAFKPKPASDHCTKTDKRPLMFSFCHCRVAR